MIVIYFNLFFLYEWDFTDCTFDALTPQHRIERFKTEAVGPSNPIFFGSMELLTALFQ